jgi:hypothetical protein
MCAFGAKRIAFPKCYCQPLPSVVIVVVAVVLVWPPGWHLRFSNNSRRQPFSENRRTVDHSIANNTSSGVIVPVRPASIISLNVIPNAAQITGPESLSITVRASSPQKRPAKTICFICVEARGSIIRSRGYQINLRVMEFNFSQQIITAIRCMINDHRHSCANEVVEGVLC